MSKNTFKTFSNEEIIAYYDQTENHYKNAYHLDESMAMHYGFWRKDTKNFQEALQHMNEEMAHMAQITASDYVLDAGCGVGGSAIFVAKHKGAKAKGITLSQLQVERATAYAKQHEVSHLVDFEAQDYTATKYADETFDVVWSLESIAYAPKGLIEEAYRVLKKGGRLIVGDCFQSRDDLTEHEEALKRKWLNPYAASDIESKETLTKILKETGFQTLHFRNITDHVRRTSMRIFLGSFVMGFFSWLYRIYNPKVRHFPRDHYKALYYQHITLRKKIWDYYLVYAEKP
ncbi:MAG: SAM-dependent methyltransferase [Flammeovirgaceae bacterium]